MSMLTESPREFANLLIDLIRSSQDGIALLDPQGVLIFCNPIFASRFGLRISDAEGKTFADIMHISFDKGTGLVLENNDIDAFLKEVKLDNQTVGFRYFESKMFNGEWFKVSHQVTPDKFTFIHTTSITKLKQTELELREALNTVQKIAATDPLTGIHNRRSFFDIASKEFQRSKRYNTPLCILSLDVDKFKYINDNYGHQCGDRILVAISQACGKALRKHDFFARIGGEEFCILLPNTTQIGAVELAERMLQAIRSLTEYEDGMLIPVTASIGLMQVSDEINSFETLMNLADKALYQAKHKGRNRIEIFA